jgi:tRNA threonylcarbamoyl adenosine modification protein YeaZ
MAQASGNKPLEKGNFMRILAFDVSVFGVSVSFLDTENSCSNKKQMETDRGQAEFLIPMIEQCVSSANVAMKNLDCIAVTRGAGSFTGVRIGLATARSLGLALDIPVIGLPTLDVIARAHDQKASTLFLIDTKRGDYYGQIGEGSEAKIWSEDDVKNYNGIIVKDALPDTDILAKMAVEKYSGERLYDITTAPTPLYLRGAEVSQSKRDAPALCFTDLE